jgi:hypothetical protein
MDLSYLPEFQHVVKFMVLLLLLCVLAMAIWLAWAVGGALVRYLPGVIDARAKRSVQKLAGPKSWTDILKREEFLGIADWFITRFTLIGVVGVVAAGAAAWLQGHYSTLHNGSQLGMRVLGLSILFAAASMLGGWLLGLLFGVPRSVAETRATAPGSSPANRILPNSPETRTRPRTQANGVNTNLTDISDWLTKTIVGVGLTQLYQVPHFLWSTAGKLNAFGFQWDPYGQLLALALFMYFAIGGFWLGYVATRTILTMLLNQIDGITWFTTRTAASRANINIGFSNKIEPAAPGSPLAEADAALLNTPREQLRSPLEIAAWGAAKARAGDLDAASNALEDALSMAPDDPVFRQLLATVYSAQGKYEESQELGADPWLEVFNALYEPPPQGFTTAIQRGHALSAKEAEGAPKSASLHLWLACAYGQKYAYEQRQSASPDALAAIKASALAESKAAIAIDPAALDTLRSVWDAPEGAVDSDLAVFKEDPEFKTLLGPK